MSIDHWRKPSKIWNTVRRNQSIRMSLRRIVRVMIRIREIGSRREENHGIQMTRRMQHHIIISMYIIEEKDFNLRSIKRVMKRSLYSVGLVLRIIIGNIVHNIRVACHRFTMPRRHK